MWQQFLNLPRMRFQIFDFLVQVYKDLLHSSFHFSALSQQHSGMARENRRRPHRCHRPSEFGIAVLVAIRKRENIYITKPSDFEKRQEGTVALPFVFETESLR
jgi:hypothetical protein